MKGFRLTPFWQAVLAALVAYLVFDNAFPPLLPQMVMILYMTITLIGILLYFASDDERWAEFKAPIAAVARDDDKALIRGCLLILIPAVAGYIVYTQLKPSLEAPVSVRQVHPAPPASVRLFGKRVDLSTLENPVRAGILETLARDPEAGWRQYGEAVRAGRDLYYQNCFHCHGDLLDGRGPYADGLAPAPIDFQDPALIPQLQESFLFWRMATGGPGLPVEGAPWDSAMPAWHEMLGEEAIWNLIIFIFDYNGQVPRIWDPEISKAVTAVKDEILARRKAIRGEALYRFRCAVCHGDSGQGDGVAAEFMYPKPRDFSLALFKYKSSPGMEPPRDEDLFNSIKFGLPGTGMAGWGPLMTDEQIRSLIPVIKGFDISATWPPEEADDDAFDDEGRYTGNDFRSITATEPLEGQIPYTEASVARGREAFKETCEPCHGAEGRGDIVSGKKLEDDWGNRIWPRNLTRPRTWRGSTLRGPLTPDRDEAIRDIYARISIGIPGTPMPAHRSTDEDNPDPVSLEARWHIANFVFSLRQGSTPPAAGSVVVGTKVEGELPVAVNDERWKGAEPVTLNLIPNVIAEERLFTPLNEAVAVRALYNESEIAFLLELDDRTESRPGDPYFTDLMDESLEMYPDAVAIQFPRENAYTATPMVEKPRFRHGDPKRNTTIWYWNAGSVEPPVPAGVALLEGSGLGKKLRPRGEGGLVASGQWRDGRWRVVMKRPRSGANGDIEFREGRFIPISFANWDGSNGESGSRHTLSRWYWLLLPPEVDGIRVYGVPVGVGVVLFLLGLGTIRIQRRKP